MEHYHCWGRYPRVHHCAIKPIVWRSEIPRFEECPHTVLPYGQGRSYGDSCLNEGGVLLTTSRLDRFMAFDKDKGLLRCEAGVTLDDILKLIVPSGWFLPVTPGTKYVSVGGAIANDVHGKNHHKASTFGCHVTQFELVRSHGERLLCSPTENAEFFCATVGGLGLTGLITWAELQLKPLPSRFIAMERIRFAHLDEFLELSAASDKDFEYTVAWIDCMARGRHLGRGLFIRGNHADPMLHRLPSVPRIRQVTLPFDAPEFLLSQGTIRAFNALYYHKQWKKRVQKVVYYDPFFYPLDAIGQWNRLYGKRGFLQYQCVVPFDKDHRAIRHILEHIAISGLSAYLAVIKIFGDKASPGMLSFPKPGVTLAVDFPYRGSKTLQLLEELDAIVRSSKGAVYSAKDARMSAAGFQAFFPQWRDFAQYIDPKFSSSFWRRVTLTAMNDAKSNDYWSNLSHCTGDSEDVRCRERSSVPCRAQ